MMNNEFEKARSYAYRLLSYRQRSGKEIESRLRQKGFEPEVTGQVIEQLAEYGYINDREFACNWVEQRLGKRGVKRLKQELFEKGVSGEIVGEALAGLDSDAEYKAAIKLAKKVLQRGDGEFSYPRLAGALNRRGFSSEVVRQVCQIARDGLIDVVWLDNL
ncbi:MAG: Regulatory protein RecX [Pelotomaculum sp. PtaB.Bin104]|nr:MAG: Regulatory protein RecX [Pelotomaculum sp. PtaB.Bin104]